MADGIGSERWADGALFKILDGRRKGAGAEDQREIMGAFLAEVSFDQTGIIDAAIDHRSGIDAVVQNNSHLSTLVLLRKGSEASSGFR